MFLEYTDNVKAHSMKHDVYNFDVCLTDANLELLRGSQRIMTEPSTRHVEQPVSHKYQLLFRGLFDKFDLDSPS